MVATDLSPIGVGAEGTVGTEMKLLLVHQLYGQFRDLGPALCDRGMSSKRSGAVSVSPIPH